MYVLRLLTAIAFLLVGIVLVSAWALWFNDGLGAFLSLPFDARDLPGGPMVGSLGGAALCWVLAAIVYPSGKDRDS